MLPQKATASDHAKLYLCHIRPVIAKELAIMGLSQYLPIFDAEEEALEEVRRSLG